jgi:isopropylmalate/homocitrate/citramalate synthase
MGRKSRSKLKKMLRATPATDAGRPSERERMRRVLWKMVERYEQDLSAGEGKPMVTGSQAIAAMRMLRDIGKEEAEAEAPEAPEQDWSSLDKLLKEAEISLAEAMAQSHAEKETADAATRSGRHAA